MNEIDPKDVNESLEPDPEWVVNKLPEAPASTHIDAYYKGFHVGFTIRSEDNTTIPSAKSTVVIDELIAQGYKPSWNEDTNVKANGKPVVKPATQTFKCAKCGGEAEYKEGVSSKNNKPYKGVFCLDKEGCGGVQWLK